jgi:peptidoglycan LD-endopeptidase LytH
MKRRRRRFFREDVIAPWAAMGVIIGFWWLSALVIGRGATPSPVALDRRAAASAPTAAGNGPASPSSEAPPPTARAIAAPESQPVLGDAERMVDENLSDDIRELRRKSLLIPVNGMKAASLHSTFGDPRGPTRAHEALDILAPRGTPVVAVTDGRVVKLFSSARGGLTVYQFDPEERFCYYYAHLDSYAPDLKEGDAVTRGQTIGFVGTTGNAPPGTPHLHFAINRLGADKRWWEGDPIDPYLAFADESAGRE